MFYENLNLDKQQSFDDAFDVNIAELNYLFGECLNEINQVRKQEIVLFLGATGAGKSTTINQLLGTEYQLHKNKVNGIFSLRPQDELFDKLVPVSHTINSGTLFPKVYNDEKNGLAYCDCPGYGDTRNGAVKLCSDFAIPLVVNQAKKIKAIVVVVDWPSVINGKGKVLSDVFSQVGQFMQNKEVFFDQAKGAWTNSIFFIFTKVDQELTYKQVVARLDDFLQAELDSNTIQELLREQKSLRQRMETLVNQVDRGTLQKQFEKIDENIAILRGKIQVFLLLRKQAAHIFINYTDGRNQLTQLCTLIKQAAPIPTDQFLSLTIEHPIIEKIAQKSVKLFKSKLHILEQITKQHEKIKALQESENRFNVEISSLIAQKQSKVPATEQRRMEIININQQLTTLDNQKAIINGKISSLDGSLRDLRSEINELNTLEPAIHVTQRVQVADQQWLNQLAKTGGFIGGIFGDIIDKRTNTRIFGYLGQIVMQSLISLLRKGAEINYRGIPFLHVEKEASAEGFNSEYSVPIQGMYSINYKPTGVGDNWAEIKIFAEKRQINKSRIDELHQEVEELKIEVSALKEDLNMINTNITHWGEISVELERSHKLDYDCIIKNFEENISTTQQLKQKIIKEIEQKQSVLDLIELHISTNLQWFKFLQVLGEHVEFKLNSNVPIFLKMFTPANEPRVKQEEHNKTAVPLSSNKPTNNIKNSEDGKGFDHQEKFLVGITDNTQMQFECKAPTNDDWVFNVLRISRNDSMRLLLSLANDQNARRELALEIMNALKANDLGVAATPTSKELFAQYSQLLQARAILENKANVLIKTHEDSNSNLRLEKLISYLTKFSETLNELELHRKLEQENEQAIEAYAFSEEMYLSYVESLETTGCLGYKAAKLIAELKNINLYIWSNANSDNQLELIDCHKIPEAGNSIHLLHNSEGTRFNLLVEVKMNNQKEQKHDFFATGADREEFLKNPHDKWREEISAKSKLMQPEFFPSSNKQQGPSLVFHYQNSVYQKESAIELEDFEALRKAKVHEETESLVSSSIEEEEERHLNTKETDKNIESQSAKNKRRFGE